jgi:hypothetical protein
MLLPSNCLGTPRAYKTPLLLFLARPSSSATRRRPPLAPPTTLLLLSPLCQPTILSFSLAPTRASTRTGWPSIACIAPESEPRRPRHHCIAAGHAGGHSDPTCATNRSQVSNWGPPCNLLPKSGRLSPLASPPRGGRVHPWGFQSFEDPSANSKGLSVRSSKVSRGRVRIDFSQFCELIQWLVNSI